MVLDGVANHRRQYHEQISNSLLALRDGAVNIADRSSESSRAIAEGIAERLGGARCPNAPTGQASGSLFTNFTKEFLEGSFRLLEKNRPGPWRFSTERPIAETDQYRHLADLESVLKQHPDLQATLGTDYIIKPDIVVYRMPLRDKDFGQESQPPRVATRTPLRAANHLPALPPDPIMHASVSCKWTMRSDRAQNTRTEALNLIRNRKGHTPHITAVTAEPLPMRIASLALGTGDLDCVYHFALYELEDALETLKERLPDQLEMLRTLIDGRRLRDISDLPFDLAI